MIYLEEMSIVNEAAQIAFDVEQMNAIFLGHGDGHVHLYLFTRNTGDIPIKGPLW